MNVIRSLFNVFIVCWSNPDSISVSIFPWKKNENYAFFSFFAIFENYLVHRLKKGQRHDQNLDHFTFYDSAVNFTSDGENLIAVCYSQQKLQSFKKMFRNGNIVDFGLTSNYTPFNLKPHPLNLHLRPLNLYLHRLLTPH